MERYLKITDRWKRAKILGKMDYFVCETIDNEEAYFEWIMYGVPDGEYQGFDEDVYCWLTEEPYYTDIIKEFKFLLKEVFTQEERDLWRKEENELFQK